MKLSVLILSLISISAWADPKVESDPLILENVSLDKKLQPGANGLLKLNLNLKAGHMAYVDKFSLKAPSIKNSKLKLAPIQKLADPHSGKLRELVTENFTLETIIEIPEDLKRTPSSLDLELTYQACTKKFCYNPKKLQIQLPN